MKGLLTVYSSGCAAFGHPARPSQGPLLPNSERRDLAGRKRSAAFRWMAASTGRPSNSMSLPSRPGCWRAIVARGAAAKVANRAATAGWTPALWQNYCEQVFTLYAQAFPHTPLIGIGEGVLIPDQTHNNYNDAENQIILALAQQGMSLVQFNESKDDLPWDKAMMAPIAQTITPLLSSAAQGTIRLGFGYDWSLWVQTAQRT